MVDSVARPAGCGRAQVASRLFQDQVIPEATGSAALWRATLAPPRAHSAAEVVGAATAAREAAAREAAARDAAGGLCAVGAIGHLRLQQFLTGMQDIRRGLTRKQLLKLKQG